MQSLDIKKCIDDKEVFYIGRRLIYALQQASEKALKAYFMAYVKLLIGKIINIIGNNVDRNRNPSAFQALRTLRDITSSVNPGNIGHKPHSACLQIMCNLYHVIYDERGKRELEELFKVLGKVLKEQAIKNFSLLAEEVGQEKAQIIVNTLKKDIIYIIEEFLTYNLIDQIRKLELPQSVRRNIEQVCIKKRKIQEKLSEVKPSCIDQIRLDDLRNFRENYEIAVKEARSLVTSEYLYNSVKPKLEELLNKVLAIILSQDPLSEIRELIDLEVRSYIEQLTPYIRDYVSDILFASYLFGYVFTLDPCLAVYEKLGRYPGRKPGSLELDSVRDGVCEDLQVINVVKEHVEFVVRKISRGLESLRYLIVYLS